MKSKHAWYEIKAQAGLNEADVFLYAEIGEDFWGDGSSIGARDFAKDLAALNVSQINLRINSPGGDVFDGQAIYNAIQRHPANVTAYVDGLAGSIASVIALGANSVHMAANAMFMIHQPSGRVRGTADDLRSAAGVLDKIGDTIAGVYEAKTGMTHDEALAAMTAETWYTAAEAKAAGFADEIDGPMELAARIDPASLLDLGYRNVPDGFGAVPSAPEKPAPEATGDARVTLDSRVIDRLATRRHRAPKEAGNEA